MSACPHAYDDGAYVLGALLPSEGAAFERHLVGCSSCRDAVAEVAAVPVQLGRLDAAEVAKATGEPAPVSRVPALIDAVAEARHRARRVGRWRSALAAAAAAGVALAAGLAVDWSRPESARPFAAATPSVTAPTAPASATAAPAAMAAMEPVRPAVPVRAEVGLRGTAWGTQVFLHCRYPGGARYSDPYEFRLVVRGPNRATEQIGSWSAGPGDDVRLTGFTRFPAARLDRIELVGPSGAALLAYDVP
ncbi:MAG TPA: zf-HC2 domain-containing protein [Micromonosporaceae bacterium]